MSSGDQFHKYGYNHYLKAPVRPNNISERTVVGVRYSVMRKFQSPVMATVALVFAAVFFVGIIILSYPSDDNVQGNIPIVKADLRPIKTYPDNRGGMDIPYSDSTLMANVGVVHVEDIDDMEGVENLLAQSSDNFDDLVSKEEAIDIAMSKSPIVKILHSSGDGEITIPNFKDEGVNNPTLDKQYMTSIVDSNKPDFDVQEHSASEVLQKIGSVSSDFNYDGGEFIQKVSSAALSKKPAVNNMLIANSNSSSSDTIDFVRSVLENKASDVASIKPAAGDVYFVQLASITNSKRAGSEWVKMQKKYSVLGASEFRVQEAVLPNGRFYRIQAGPMSKSKAVDVCAALKKENKPGGCLVVK